MHFNLPGQCCVLRIRYMSLSRCHPERSEGYLHSYAAGNVHRSFGTLRMTFSEMSAVHPLGENATFPLP